MFKKQSKPNENGKNKETEVAVHFPNEIGIELVQANELRHYELFLTLTGLNSSIAVGFWTAYATSSVPQTGVSSSAIAFSAIAFLFLILGIFYRRKIYHGSIVKKIFLKDFK
ncbi:MAG: LPXTG cell wall anchor domain-containing protein [Candidatus Woesebacteria bacterium]|nr:LPXTG cell wall anchor domain-containing protein [Candidatus Woesebacteria bacterium]